MAKPVLQALVLADQIYQDGLTGKMVIAGTFTRLRLGTAAKPLEASDQTAVIVGTPRDLARSSSMPYSRLGSPFAYLCLTEISGERFLELRYVDLKSNLALFSIQLSVKCDDPLQAVELRVPIPPLPELPGEFVLELLSDDEILGSWRVSVVQSEVD